MGVSCSSTFPTPTDCAFEKACANAGPFGVPPGEWPYCFSAAADCAFASHCENFHMPSSRPFYEDLHMHAMIFYTKHVQTSILKGPYADYEDLKGGLWYAYAKDIYILYWGVVLAHPFHVNRPGFISYFDTLKLIIVWPTLWKWSQLYILLPFALI